MESNLDKKMNTVLKKVGGFAVDHQYIKYIFAGIPPSGVKFGTKINNIITRYYFKDGRVKEVLVILLYEQIELQGWFTRNLMFIGFNDKVYKVISKQNYHKRYNDQFNQYNTYKIEAAKLK